MIRNILLLLTVVILFGAGLWFFFLKNNPVEKVGKGGPVIFFGNSLTTGVGAPEGQNFPTLIAEELKLDAIISGVPGDTTETALNRLQPDVLEHNPSLVVVELSGNDFLGGVPTDKTINNLDSITRQIREIGSRVILIHIKFPRNNDDYEKGFKEVAKKYDAVVVWNVLGGVIGNPSLMVDNIHPNAAGYKIMADRIAKVLKPLIK